MKTYIALLRGINVGGKNVLKMAELCNTLAAAGFDNPRTYIQSGNVFFQSEQEDVHTLSDILVQHLRKHHAIATTAVVLRSEQLSKIAQANPFPAAENLDKSLQLFFLHAPATDPSLDKLNALKAASEHFELSDSCFYLLAPEGIGRSKLAAAAEQLLGVATTTRNWRTVNQLLARVS